MTSQHRKRRGMATQRLVADYWRELWPHCEATGAGESGRDIKGTPGASIEVKARAGFSPLEAMRQAKTNAGDDIPVVIMRMNGQGEASLDDWLAIVPQSVMRELLRRAGYGYRVIENKSGPSWPTRGALVRIGDVLMRWGCDGWETVTEGDAA